MLACQEMTIRPYQTADEPAVIALWEACGLVVPHNDPRKDIARKLAVDPDKFLVAELEGAVAGTCMVGYDGHRGWINYLAVQPSQQGRGYARQLMAEAERLLRAAGCPKINLQVRPANDAVIAFYERLGFSPGRRDQPGQALGGRLISV